MLGPARIAQIWLAEQEINGVPCSQSSFRELSRNSGLLWGPGLHGSDWSWRPGTEAVFSFPIRVHAPLRSCWCASLMNGALGDSDFILLALHAPRLVRWRVWGLGHGISLLKRLVSWTKKGVGGESQRTARPQEGQAHIPKDTQSKVSWKIKSTLSHISQWSI